MQFYKCLVKNSFVVWSTESICSLNRMNSTMKPKLAGGGLNILTSVVNVTSPSTAPGSSWLGLKLKGTFSNAMSVSFVTISIWFHEGFLLLLMLINIGLHLCNLCFVELLRMLCSLRSVLDCCVVFWLSLKRTALQKFWTQTGACFLAVTFSKIHTE